MTRLTKCVQEDRKKECSCRYITCTQFNRTKKLFNKIFGLTAEQLIRNKRWLLGPEFLWKSDECWPCLVTVANIPDDRPGVKHEVQTYAMSHKNVMN